MSCRRGGILVLGTAEPRPPGQDRERLKLDEATRFALRTGTGGCQKERKRLAVRFLTAKRFQPLLQPCASNLTSLFVPGVLLLSARRFCVKLFGELNNPSPFRIEELHANGKAIALQRLAVGYSSRGAKLSGARGELQ